MRDQQPLQPFDVHRLVQAVGDRLIGQRMIGDLAIAGDVLSAGHLVGEHAGDQILRLHARELRRDLLAAAEPRQRQRDTRHPPPPRGEHRRIEQSLDQQRSHAVGTQILRHLRQFETVRRGQRQHDIVLGRRRLQFEVEFAAEALAQREAPGAVDPAAERRVDHKLHAARLRRRSVPARWCRASAGIRARRTTLSDTRATAPPPLRRCRSRSVSQRCALPPDASRRSRVTMPARRRDTDAESSSLRPGASPSQNGIVGGWPCASSTRTMPRSTRMMR